MSGPLRVADTTGAPAGAFAIAEAPVTTAPGTTAPVTTAPGTSGSPRITGVSGVAAPPAISGASGAVTVPEITDTPDGVKSSGFTYVSGTSCCGTTGTTGTTDTATVPEPRPQAVSPVSIGRPSTTPHPGHPPVRERWHLFAPDFSSVPRARHMTRDCLEGWGLQEQSQVAELLVSELVTNALRHSGGAIRLALFLADGMLRGEVEDADPSLPRVCQARDEDERGRGMYLLELLSCCWGSARTAKGKTVWFELTTHPARG